MAGGKAKTFVFSILPLLLLLLVVEIGLRACHYRYEPRSGYFSLGAVRRAAGEEFDFDRQLIWKLKADSVYPGDSAPPGPRRMRTPPFDNEKKAGVKRVVCLGDSATYGFELGFDQTWPRQLERELYALGITAEVINAGVSGYTSLQGLRYYRRELARLKPDLLITQFGRNDGKVISYLAGSSSYEMGEDKNLRLPHPLIFQAFRFLSYFRTFQLLWSLTDKLNSYFRDPDQQAVRYRVSPEDYRQNLAQLDELQKNNGRLLALIPCHVDWIDNRLKPISNYLPPTEYTVDVCQIMQRAAPQRPQSLFLDDYHFNAAGCRVFAHSLAREIVQKGLLK